MEGLGLLFEGGHEVVDHVQENEPSLVVLRALQREAVTSLLREGLLGHVFGKLKTLGFHADVCQYERVGAEVPSEDFLHFPDTQTHDGTETFAPGHLVDAFQGRRSVSEIKIEPAGVSPVNEPGFEAFHRKGKGGADGYGVESVGVAVEIYFGDGVGIENPEIGPAAGDGIVFGAVNKNFPAAVGAGHRDEILDPVGTGNGASQPAAVKAFVEKAPVHLLAQIEGLGMLAVAEVLGGQAVIGIHDVHYMGRTHHSHFVLLGV